MKTDATAESLEGRLVFLAGGAGLAGSALRRRLQAVPGARVAAPPRSELDLTRAGEVECFLERLRPDVVIVAAGRVGGIAANMKHPADFIRDNLLIEANVIHGAWKAGVRRLLNFGSGCMYPRACAQPMAVEALYAGPMEPTSRPYAVAKLAGLEMCAAYNRQHGTRYLTAIPAGVYGPGDRFDPETAHVIPALLRRFHEAKESGAPTVTLWGTGRAKREFLYVDDLAEACVVLLEKYGGDAPVNIGPGVATSIAELAAEVARVTGYGGRVEWDAARPAGADEKSLDSRVMRHLGWRPRTSLREGLEQTWRWFLANPRHDAYE